MRCLFIGGIIDGKWLDIVPSNFVQIPNNLVLDLHEPGHCSYRREDFRDGENNYTVYVHGIERGKMVERLLAYYRPRS